MKAWHRLLLLLLFTAPALSQEVDQQAIIDTPKRFYQAVNARDYPSAWSLLTETSKSRLSAAIAQDAKLEATAVRAMFEGNAPELRDGFWESLRAQSHPELLVQATYTFVGPQDGGFVVRLSGPNSKPEEALDMLVKDENGYRFGLTETMKY